MLLVQAPIVGLLIDAVFSGRITAAETSAVEATFGTVNAKDGSVFTCAVGRFRPNLFGLYDTTGNAAEWCSDWYGDDYYAKSPLDDPQGPPAGTYRVLRGGGWFHGDAVLCRSAYRNFNSPAYRHFDTGFRVLCSR